MDSVTKALRRFEAELGEPVAGNGLLHRRAFLRGGIAFTGLTLYVTHVRTAPKRKCKLV